MAKSTRKSNKAAEIRRAERAVRAANDPWFGKRRPGGEMGNAKSKAARSKGACRGRVDF